MQSSENEKNMSFWEHLDELRMTFIHILIFLMVAFVGWFIAMPFIFDSFVLGPTSSDFFLYQWFASLGRLPFFPDFGDQHFSVDIINIQVASQFMTHMSSSFYFALVVTFPYMIYELWKFIRPALLPGEKKNIGIAFSFSTLMFYLGCAVGYILVFPLTFRFLTQYTLGSEIVNQINLGSYMGMFILLIVVMGIVFELPLLAWVLSKLGLISKAFLRTYRRHAIVVIMILSAIITPSGDPFTMMVVFLPIYLLYELSIKIVRE